MISQADIIRTLVNKNCTDESVMSTALSPDCKPPKLLEKLTEAERFDLALDFSMKLGQDVIPLWRTWAMRCLQNRNFQGAREKFRHCFLRLRLPGNRISPIVGNLLADITNELMNMSEIQLSLADEVELIKQNRLDYADVTIKTQPHDESITNRPRIYSECLYYLNEYGVVEDRIQFYIKNSLYDEAIRTLVDTNLTQKINIDRFFILEVVLYTLSRGKFSDLINAFLRIDPDVIISVKYFKLIYNFCSMNRRYNTLYYVQNAISDYVAAARTQIDNFFLRQPIKSYREYNQRLSSLILSSRNYELYLNKLKISIEARGDKTKQTDKSMSTSLFSSMPEDEVRKQIEIIALQLDITKNFALNEVTGCINGIDLGIFKDSKHILGTIDNEQQQQLNDSIPVTLFDKDERRKTFLAALIFIYYDLTCSAYFSKSGLDLASKIIRVSIVYL